MARAPFAIWLLATLALGGCGQETDDPFGEARRLREQGRLAGAVVHLKTAIQHAPSDSDVRFALGEVYLDAFDGVSAEREITKALELGTVEDGRVAAALARSLWLQGNHKRIIEQAKVAQSYEPALKAEILSYRGQGQAALGQIAEARQTLDAARRLTGGQPSPLVDVLEASVRASSGDVDGALSLLNRTLQTHPRLYDALAVRADLVRLTGTPEAAIAAYSDLLLIHPTNLLALLGRSTLLADLGKFDQAEKDLATLQSAFKNHFIVHFQDGLIRFRKGQFRTALEAFQRTHKVNRDFEPAQLYEGMSHLMLGNPASAQRLLNQYVTSRPGDLPAGRMLAGALLLLNEPRQALAVIESAIQGGATRPSFWEMAAEAHARLGELDKAAQWLDKIEQQRPTDASVQKRQAALNLRRGHIDAALAHYAEAARVDKTSSTADTMLVLLKMRKRDYSAALAAADRLVEKTPGQSFGANLRGTVLLELGRQEEARTVFEAVLNKEPGFLPAAVNLARLDLMDGNTNGAKKRIEAVLNADKTHLQALVLLSNIEQNEGRTSRAMSLLERAVSAHSAAVNVCANLVRLLIKEGRLQDARIRADDCVGRNPGSTAALELQGHVQLAHGDKYSALATFARITEMAPTSPAAHLERAKAERLAGLLKEAEASARRALELQESLVPAQVMLFELMMQQNRPKQAAGHAEQLQAKFPKSYVGFMLEAELFLATKKFRDAADSYRKAQQLAEASPQLAIRLYLAQSLAGESQAALDELKQWVGTHPTHVQPHMLLGDVLIRAGDYAGAGLQYEAALRIAPIYAPAARGLAWSFHKAGDNAKALRFALGAYKLAPEDPIVIDAFGWMLLHAERVKEAKEMLAKAVAAQIDSPDVRYRYAVVLSRLGENDVARSELSAALASTRSFPERDAALALAQRLGR